MASKARRNAGRSSFVAAKNRIRGARNVHGALAEFRKSGDCRQFGQMLRWIQIARPNGVDLALGWKPSAIKNLLPRLALDPASLERELRWASETFVLHASEMNQAWRQIRDVEDAVIAGDFGEALNQLANIDQANGYTTWSIEMRLALLQHHEGILSQKAYAKEIRETANQVVALVSHFTSQRNEEQMSLARFEANLDRQLAPQTGIGGTYLRYRLLHKVEVVDESYSAILNAESQSATLDYYETFVALAQRAALQTCPEQFKELLVQTVRRIARSLDDPRLQRVLMVLCASAPTLGAMGDRFPKDQIRPDATDYLSDAEAWRLASEGLAFQDTDSASRLTSNAVASQTMAALDSLATFPELGDEVANTQRLAANLRGLQPGRALQCALDEQFASTMEQLQECRAAAAMHARHLWPTHLLGCRNTDQLDLLVDALRASHVPTQLVAAALCELGATCPPDSEQALDALKAEVEKVIEGAYEAPATTLPEEPPVGPERARSRIALRLQSSMHLRRGEVDEVVSLLASCAALGRNVGILPIAETVSQIDTETTRRLANNLALPIVLDLYVRYISPELEEDRAYACEDVLTARGVKTPFELTDRASEDEGALLAYFLRFLAVPDVMESFTVFESTRDLEEERIRVLSFLISIDPARAEAYEVEAKEITRNQAIQQGVRQAEQSKIYVDLARIRKVLEAELQDDFIRYMSLPHLPDNESKENLLEALRIVLSQHSQTAFPEIPQDESSALLVQMVSTAFSELTSNKEHGLDCYLSMRIRHGALSGQLRTPMERQRLITQVSADGITYEQNTTWLDSESLGALGAIREQAVQFKERLNQLSEDYDQLVDALASEYVQICSLEKPLAWFDIKVRQIHILDLMASISQGTSFEDFLDLLIALFFDELARQLSGVRAELENSIKPIFLEMIGSFELDVMLMTDAASQPAINSALATARLEVQQALDVVKDWFQLPQIDRLQHTFEMDELVQIGLQCVKALHVDYHPDVTTDIGQITTILDPLVIFTDIFVILFDNARVHSGSQAPNIQVTISETDEVILLRVENSVEGSISEERGTKIESIRERIESGSYIDSVAKEGGSGLIKLQRIASSLDESATIGFGSGENRFWTTVPIRVRYL